ncbi:MAG: HD domain-containing protein [Streptosporangiaceae bacterium]
MVRLPAGQLVGRVVAQRAAVRHRGGQPPGELFGSEGAEDYLGEPVTQAAHMLQAAALAERDGAPGALVAAALLHDVGHFTGTVTGRDLMRGTDNRHSEQGADWLAHYTLGVQGGPMAGAQLAAFEARPHAAAACRVRRWDDAAKDPAAGHPPLAHFVPLLRGLLTG